MADRQMASRLILNQDSAGSSPALPEKQLSYIYNLLKTFCYNFKYNEDDIEQEIYLHCLENLHKFDKTRADIFYFIAMIIKTYITNKGSVIVRRRQILKECLQEYKIDNELINRLS